MYRVQFTDFRCFGQMAPVEIRPITFLIGENSTGKTSFMAGLRYVLESFAPRRGHAFNRDPFFLGGFEQIARVKGGRAARTNSFRMGIEFPDTDGRSSTFHGAVGHHFILGKGTPQPELLAYELRTDCLEVRIDLSEDKPSARIVKLTQDEKPVTVQLEKIMPAFLLRDHAMPIVDALDQIRWYLNRDRVPSRRRGSEDDATHRPDWKVLDALHQVISRRRHDMRAADVFAFAPVRTQPQRNYTPSELLPSSEGAHVPLALSQARSRDPARWSAMRAGLIRFGKASGLFTDIDVRQLGKGDTDPFQIMVKVNGPAMNLMDVGYGVSQILPILYQVQQSAGEGTYLLQQPEVHLHPRAQAELGSLLASIIANPRPRSRSTQTAFVVETHSDYLVDRVRIEVASGTIAPEDVTILFFQRDGNEVTTTNLYLNKNGEIRDPPDGFREFFLREHARLLGL